MTSRACKHQVIPPSSLSLSLWEKVSLSLSLFLSGRRFLSLSLFLSWEKVSLSLFLSERKFLSLTIYSLVFAPVSLLRLNFLLSSLYHGTIVPWLSHNSGRGCERGVKDEFTLVLTTFHFYTSSRSYVLNSHRGLIFTLLKLSDRNRMTRGAICLDVSVWYVIIIWSSKCHSSSPRLSLSHYFSQMSHFIWFFSTPLELLLSFLLRSFLSSEKRLI